MNSQLRKQKSRTFDSATLFLDRTFLLVKSNSISCPRQRAGDTLFQR